MTKREEEDFLKGLGGNIAITRKLKKISQKKLAELCEVEPPNMRRIESGRTNPTIKTLLKISSALGIEVKRLLDF